MPTFEPPTQKQGMEDYFWGRFPIPVGQSVVQRNGRFVVTPTPWIGELANLKDGIHYFLGGHVYEIDMDTAGQLVADGFDVSGYLPPPPTDSPAYGRGIYGVGRYGS